MTLQSSAEHPVPVRTVSKALGDWVHRLGAVWIEGQVAQLSRRAGASTVFLTLRDPAADASLQVTCARGVIDGVVPALAEGARVVVHGRPSYWFARGTLSIAATEIRHLGLGALLARLEHLRRVLAAEGVFDAERKRPLPFLPRTIGLVCGRGSAAEHDVLENARRRWPAVRFRVENVAVQGPTAVVQVLAALRVLDADPEVDVVVLARGGGSVEDLLPFSDEALVRAVAGLRTPLVSAIGHETDAPLVDLVADLRASTPTDAAKHVVPDVAEEQARIDALRQRARQRLGSTVERELAGLAALRSRPALADPSDLFERRAADVAASLMRARRCVAARLDTDMAGLEHLRARVRALSPAATLERGYAVVQRSDGVVVRDPGEVSAGEALRLRVARGDLAARVERPPREASGRHSSRRSDGHRTSTKPSDR